MDDLFPAVWMGCDLILWPPFHRSSKVFVRDGGGLHLLSFLSRGNARFDAVSLLVHGQVVFLLTLGGEPAQDGAAEVCEGGDEAKGLGGSPTWLVVGADVDTPRSPVLRAVPVVHGTEGGEEGQGEEEVDQHQELGDAVVDPREDIAQGDGETGDYLNVDQGGMGILWRVIVVGQEPTDESQDDLLTERGLRISLRFFCPTFLYQGPMLRRPESGLLK